MTMYQTFVYGSFFVLLCSGCGTRNDRTGAYIFNLPEGKRQITIVGKEWAGQIGSEGIKTWSYPGLSLIVNEKADTLINPEVSSFDYENEAIGFIFIDQKTQRIRVQLLRMVKDRNGHPVSLEPNPINGEYEMKPAAGSP